jgi:site-specific DNA recombinase
VRDSRPSDPSAAASATPTTYVCFSRQRYGTGQCPSERLPADQLDRAVLQALLDTYQHTDLFEEAAAATTSQAATLRQQRQGELAAIATDLNRAKAAIERYLDAFEAGTLPEATCGKRLQALGAKVADLRARQAELNDALAAISATPLSATELRDLTARIRAAVDHGRQPCRRHSSTAWSRRSAWTHATTSSPGSAYPRASHPTAAATGRFDPCTGRCTVDELHELSPTFADDVRFFVEVWPTIDIR